MDKNTVFITGYAKLPEGITAKEMYKVICIGLLLDSESGRIEDADCTLATVTARTIVKDILTDKNINNMDEIIQEIEARYWGHAKKAVIAAAKMCAERFYAYKLNKGENIN
ncbi:MAG: DUF3870 domain-containing protein [Thermoanaerobacteraceae bacterium]|nr:DUF3870 domain-containing protein [Thermoanaerobacteraceae bacterium]